MFYKFNFYRIGETLPHVLLRMVRGGRSYPLGRWVIPSQGRGMVRRRAEASWRMLTEPEHTDLSDIGAVFFEDYRDMYYSEQAEQETAMAAVRSAQTPAQADVALGAVVGAARAAMDAVGAAHGPAAAADAHAEQPGPSAGPSRQAPLSDALVARLSPATVKVFEMAALRRARRAVAAARGGAQTDAQPRYNRAGAPLGQSCVAAAFARSDAGAALADVEVLPAAAPV